MLRDSIYNLNFLMQTWWNNMQDKSTPTLTELSPDAHEFTRVTFCPDLERKQDL